MFVDMCLKYGRYERCCHGNCYDVIVLSADQNAHTPFQTRNISVENTRIFQNAHTPFQTRNISVVNTRLFLHLKGNLIGS